MEVIKIPETGFSANCYVVYSAKTKKAIIIDPSCDLKVLEDIKRERGLDYVKIVLTHGHADHIRTIEEVREEYELPVYVHKGDKEMLAKADINFSSMMYRQAIEIEADHYMEDGDFVDLDDEFKLEVIHTPGHSQGSVCLSMGQVLITGDTIFQGSIGRTDFPGGDYKQIIDSIKTKLLSLDDETIFLPGHGEQTSVAIEKRINPFIS